MKRGVCLPTRELGLSRLVFVGASHTSKMATLLGLDDKVIYLSLPAQTAPKACVDTIVTKIQELGLTKKDALIIDIFSSSVLMGSDEMGMPVPAFQTEPGRYHISGCLEIAPEGVLKKRFSAVRPILEAAGDAVRVCLLPLPRYVREPCCKVEGHLTNFLEDDFEDILIGAASTARNIVVTEGEKAGLSLYTFDPVAAMSGGDKLSAKTSSAGLSVWLENDPVHLTGAAYRDIGSLVLNQATLAVQGKEATSNRRRLNSIVPVVQQATRQPTVAREPGWISGTENPSNSNNSGGFGRGGRGRGRGQRWNSGRGRGNRSFPY